MRISHGLAPIALLAAMAAPALAGTITIEASGEVNRAPDTAFINSGVTTQAPTAREALDANSEAMAALIAELADAGIERRDIQTSGFSVSPNYVYSDERDEAGYTRPPRIDGYQVSNSVTVRVRDITALGSVLDRSVTVGANTVNGVSFSLDDPKEAYDEARRIAFEEARATAELYAELSGETLGSIESVRETTGAGFPPQPMAARADMALESMSVPVEAGELGFSVAVTVTWDTE